MSFFDDIRVLMKSYEWFGCLLLIREGRVEMTYIDDRRVLTDWLGREKGWV
jgi:hypothetical protein